MTIQPDWAIRWKRFRGFADTGWQDMKPLTILIGPNNGGKSSLIAPLLMLKQTLDTNDPSLALVSRGGLVDVGGYSEYIHARNSDESLDLQIWRNRHFIEDPLGEDAKKDPLYQEVPNLIQLGFIRGRPVASAELDVFRIMGRSGRRYVHRRKLPDGNYSILLREPLPNGTKVDRKVVNAIREAKPEHFYFNGQEAFQAELDWRFEHSNDSETREIASRAINRYSATTSWVNLHHVHALKLIRYLGPLRAAPKRVYQLSPERRDWVGTSGEYAPSVYFQLQAAKETDKIDEWLRRFGFSAPINASNVFRDDFSIELGSGPRKANLADVGFGMSQVFPLIVQTFAGPGEMTMITEQPEIHLNPRFQLLLADLFVDAVKNGQQVIVETHSEHLLLRLRSLIATKQIEPSEVNLIFVEKQDDQSVARHIEIDDLGHIESSEWPKGFFKDDVNEALRLSIAQAKRDG